MRRICFRALLALPLLALPASAATTALEVTVAAGKHDRSGTPVRQAVTLPTAFADAKLVTLRDEKDKPFAVAQLTGPSLLDEGTEALPGGVRRELHFILPPLKASESHKLKGVLNSEKPESIPADSFSWHDNPGESSELHFKDLPVLRYICKPFDDSTKQKREETYKVFHQLWDPAGKQLVTNGVDSTQLYPHHRGIFYGFREVTYDDGKKTDIWHCPKAYQENEKFLETEAGPVLGRQRVLIAWHGEEKEIFAHEERELTVYNTPGGRLVEFASRLRPVKGVVHLDGDPQHAGFHFRAAREVADKTKEQTTYIRPDGVGKPDETRNWDPKTKEGPVNLPWDAMSFVVGDNRYTVAYLDRPENPKEARFSERDYGRFGSYFVADATEKKPVEVDYRLWLQDGQMTVEEAAAKSADFVAPAEVSVKTARIDGK
jgi:Methane oxygenase PmoA